MSKPTMKLLDEAHILICQAVGAENNGKPMALDTYTAMRQWLVDYADSVLPESGNGRELYALRAETRS
jgi:hypothetical protein